MTKQKSHPRHSTNRSPIHPSWLPIIEEVHRRLPEVRALFKQGRGFRSMNKGKPRGPQPRKRRRLTAAL